MERQWMTRAAPMRFTRTPAATPARVGATDSVGMYDSYLDTSTNAFKGSAVGSSLGFAGGLWFGFIRGGHAIGWPMLGWSFLGSLVVGGLGRAVGSLADKGPVAS